MTLTRGGLGLQKAARADHHFNRPTHYSKMTPRLFIKPNGTVLYGSMMLIIDVMSESTIVSLAHPKTGSLSLNS